MDTKLKLTDKFAYSFFNFNAYKDFIKEGLGKSILYIFIVSLVFSTFANFTLTNLITNGATEIKEVISKRIPDFNIKDGKFQLDSNEPVIYEAGNDLTYILDTTGKITTSSLDKYESAFLIDSNNITFKYGTNIINFLPISIFPDLTKEALLSEIDLTVNIYVVLIFLLGPIFSFIGKLLSVFVIIGPITYLINRIFDTKLDYFKSCTIGFYAITLPLLIKTLLNVAGINLLGFSLVYYSTAFLYSGFALSNIKNSEKPNINVV